MTKEVTCLSCGYSADISTYHPCFSSVYNDCRCPKCGSTANQHNRDYAESIFAAMNQLSQKENK